MAIRSPVAKTLKLRPRKVRLPDGSRAEVHPFVWCMTARLGERSKTALAQHLGVAPQMVYKWQAKCRDDQNFSLPAERAQAIAEFFAVEPRLFRPDIYHPTKG